MGNPDIVVVGSGFFGSTIANLAAEKAGLNVLVVEKREHVGGNAYSEVDEQTGIHVHKYGSHIFHTNNEDVWNYIQNFTEMNSYRHRVKTFHQGDVYDFPINLSTLNQFFKINFNPQSATEFFEKFKNLYLDPANFEEKAMSMIGPDLYSAFIKNYTQKQWQIDPKILPSGIISRIPTRTNYNQDYFDDKYQGIPTNGYTSWILEMLNHRNISLRLGVDYLKVKEHLPNTGLVVFTGPIDHYFNYVYGRLGWRTLDFKIQRLDISDYQGVAVMNYPDLEFEFTRIHEFKHFQINSRSNKTLIMKEYSRIAEGEDEPYYPVNTSEDRLKLTLYRKLASLERGVLFGGRLGSYQYLDMHMAIASAKTMWHNEIAPKLQSK